MEAARKIIYLAIFLFIINLVVPSANAQLWPGKLSPEILHLIKKASSREDYSEAGAVILLREASMTVGRDGLFSVKGYIVGKIKDEKAASDYSQISIYMNSYYEDITLDFAHTIGKDGKIIEVSKDAIQLKSLSKLPGVKRYTDIQVLTFSLPALDKGVIFEYQVMVRQKKSMIPNRWCAGFNFNHLLRIENPPYISRIDPVLKSRFVLKIPKGEKFVYQTRNIKVVPKIKKEKWFATYTWETNKLPAITMEESMPPINDVIPKLYLTSLREWEEIDRWANGLFLDKIEVPKKIKTKAQEITKKAETEIEKIEALFYFIERKIEYIQADLNRGGYRPHFATEILKNQYGDCKDQVILFISMLKSLGITAYPALINPYPSTEVNKKIISPNFKHLIVYIPRKKNDLWLDTTSGVTKFPYLCWPNQGRWALVVNGNGGKFLKTPLENAENNEGIVRFDWSFRNETVCIMMNIEGKGGISDNLKSFLKPISSIQQSDIIRSVVKSLFPIAQIQTIEFSDLKNPQIPFKAIVKIELQDSLKNTMDFLQFFGNVLPSITFFTFLHNLPLPEKRVNDYVLGFKYRLVEEWLCFPPTTYFRPNVLPQDVSVDTRFFNFHTKFTSEGENVRVSSEFMLKKNRIQQKEYNEFYENIQDVIKKSQWQLVFNKQQIDVKEKSLEVKVEESPQDAKNLLNLSKHYLTKGKYEEALELLQKAIIEEPTNGEIHYHLGIALGYLNQYDKAAKEFKKAKELGYRP